MLKTDDGMDQFMFNLSTRTENKIDDNTVFGWFAGAYGSRNQVTHLAEGTITGFGINAGVFGAKRLVQSLVLDYYAGASMGQHRFDLTFDRGFDIDATGDYRYSAYFAGAAISGDAVVGSTTVSPRVGIDVAYTDGADVNITAANEFRSETGTSRIDAMSGARVFAEVQMVEEMQGDASTSDITFTPIVFCDRPIGKTQTECGFGAGVEYARTDAETGSDLILSVSGEQSKSSSSMALGLGYETEILNGQGTSRASFSLNNEMKSVFGYTMNVEF